MCIRDRYYAQEFLKSLRKASSNGIDRNSSIALNAVFKKTESAKKNLNLTARQGEEHVKAYCSNMYDKVVATAKDPKSDKDLSARKLGTMIDFIQVLTTFGELSPDWLSKQNMCISMMKELREGKAAAKVSKPSDSAGKPLGSKLAYEEFDNSFEYDGKSSDTFAKTSIDFDEAEDSVYFDPAAEKGKKPSNGKASGRDTSTDSSPVDSEEFPIPSPGKFVKTCQLNATSRKEFLKPGGKAKGGNMMKPKGVTNAKKL
eukprot:TRINITY_DN1356_c0_g1_i3.p1 TRINITY_DN1356_c0_g1~~TRINITY_DN1356_c0_g1_i3.p1  ORF type:complete len:258 (+),score=95.71 TRINITY_DN1356_c0_g1_i3:66-839(+)